MYPIFNNMNEGKSPSRSPFRKKQRRQSFSASSNTPRGTCVRHQSSTGTVSSMSSNSPSDPPSLDSGETYASAWCVPCIEQVGDDKVNGSWKCKLCHKQFKHWNATKVVAHLTNTKGYNVAVCRGRKDPIEVKKYQMLWDVYLQKQRRRRNSTGSVRQAIEENNSSMAVHLETQTQRSSATVRLANGSRATNVTSGNESQLTMAIANFIHRKGLPFNAASGPEFAAVLKMAK